MQKKRFSSALALIAGFMLVGAFALGFAGCGDAESGPAGTRDPAIFMGTADGVTYTLTIEDSASRAVLVPGPDDWYTLTRGTGPGAKTSSGRVFSFVNNILTLVPGENPDETFTITVATNSITAMSGSITWDDGSTDPAPGNFSPPVIAFVSVAANGNASTTTTQLTLIFSQAIPGLSASDITLNGIAGVGKGSFGGSGPVYTLGISGFSAGGTLNVSVVRAGFTITGSPKPVAIYYAGGGGQTGWTWTVATVPPNFDHQYSEDITRIAWGGGKFVALGDDNSHIAWANDNALDTWAGHTIDSPAISRTVEDLAYGNGYFVTVGDSNTYQGAISLVAYASDTNPSSWATVPSLPFDQYALGNYANFHGVAHGSDKFVAVGYATVIIYAYDNAPGTWLLAKDLVFPQWGEDELFCVAYGDGKWVTGGSYERIDMGTLTSEDGGLILWAEDDDLSDEPNFWNRVELPALGGRSITSMAFGGGKFIIGAQEKMYYADSSNLSVWTEIPTSAHGFGFEWINDIAFGDGIFAAAGDNAKYAYAEPGNIMTSWTRETIASFIPGGFADEEDIYSIAYGNGRWVAGSGNTRLAYAVTGPGNEEDQTLSGTIAIKLNGTEVSAAQVGDTLSAAYEGGSEAVSYQWKRGDVNIGTGLTCLADQAGSYTVTVSAEGYKSKTSGAVILSSGGGGSLELGAGEVWHNLDRPIDGKGYGQAWLFIDGIIYSLSEQASPPYPPYTWTYPTDSWYEYEGNKMWHRSTPGTTYTLSVTSDVLKIYQDSNNQLAWEFEKLTGQTIQEE